MRAVPVEEPETSALVLVEREILAHEAHGLDRIGVEFARAADRHPVAAQQLSHGRARADLGEKAVLFGTEHARPRCCLVAARRLLLEFPTSATAIVAWLPPQCLARTGHGKKPPKQEKQRPPAARPDPRL